MLRIRALASLAVMTAFCVALNAQAVQTISIRLLDGKTGLPVKASNFLVRVDHNDTVHQRLGQDQRRWHRSRHSPRRRQRDLRQGHLRMGMDTYVDCDAAKESDKERNIWYPVSTILAPGSSRPTSAARPIQRQARRVRLLCPQARLARSIRIRLAAGTRFAGDSIR